MRFKSYAPLINTPLQRGGRALGNSLNRFSGFACLASLPNTLKTAEAVQMSCPGYSTPLKQGVNESGALTAPSYSRFTFHVSRFL